MDPLSWGATIYVGAMSWGLVYAIIGQRRVWRDQDAARYGRHHREDEQ